MCGRAGGSEEVGHLLFSALFPKACDTGDSRPCFSDPESPGCWALGHPCSHHVPSLGLFSTAKPVLLWRAERSAVRALWRGDSTGNEDRLTKNQGKLVGAAAMLADKGKPQLSQPKEVPFMWGVWASPLSIPNSSGAELTFLGHWPPSEDAMGSFAWIPCRMTLASPRLKKGVLGAAGSPYGKLPSVPHRRATPVHKTKGRRSPCRLAHCS